MSEKMIAELFSQFALEKGYKNRLLFFDRHFAIIPNTFTCFDLHLGILHNHTQLNLLKDIYKMESSQSVSLKREFIFENRQYLFDVTPLNSCPPVFNNFILDKFTLQDAQFNELINCIEKDGQAEGKPVSVLLKETDLMLGYIKKLLEGTKKKSFRIQIMTVFRSGYTDCLSGNTKIFRYRKKIIELYLYAQGILYCRYQQALKIRSLQGDKTNEFAEAPEYAILDWPEQILLLKKMGILDLLKNKTTSTPEATTGKRYQYIVCRIIGQELHMADSIGQYLNLIENL